MVSHAYSAHSRLVDPARSHAQLWRLIIGCGVVITVGIILNMSLWRVLMAAAPNAWVPVFDGSDMPGDTPVQMLILLGSYGFIIIGVAMAVILLHQRPLRHVMGGWGMTLRHIRQVAVVILAVAVVLLILPPYNLGLELTPNLPLMPWLLLLPLSVLAVGIQCAAEEILFRGYLQQQLAARFASPLIWMGVPSVLFALGHYLPTQAGENAVLITVWAGLFGLFAADLTARSGSLGPAIAMHVANNISALLLISLPDGMSGLSLYTVPFAMDDAEAVQAWLPVDFAMMAVFWLSARLAIRR